MIFRRRRRQQNDFQEEIQAHLKLEMDRLREQGVSDKDAEAIARRAFGNPTSVSERFYDASHWRWWDQWKKDLRHALRLTAKNRTLSAIIVLTLALGIGANSVIFSVVRAVVLRPLPYPEPDRLVQLWDSGARSGGESDWVSFPDFKDWQRENRVFAQMAAYHFALLTMTGERQPESVLGLEVTDRLFSVLGVEPALGRTFLPGEDTPGHEPVAVISDRVWKNRFDSDPRVAGRRLTIEGKIYTVVGVMPPSFRFPNAIPGDNMVLPIDLWIPMRSTPDLEQRGSHNYWAIARLTKGITMHQALANLNAIAQNLARQHPDTNKDMGVGAALLQDHLTRGVRPALVILLAAVGLVLLLACANIGNLLLCRAESRRREMATREALGASRARLICQTLTESLLLAVLGGLAGLAIAHYGTGLLLRFGPSTIPRFQESALDLQVLLFTAGISVAAGLLFGLAPALLSVCSNVYGALKEAGTRSTAGPANLRIRNILVAGEVALAAMILISAGLLIRSFVRVAQLDLGFNSDRVLSGIVSLRESRYSEKPKQVAFFEEALRRIAHIPGVESAAVSNSLPLTGINDQGDFRIEGQPRPLPGQDGPQANRPHVSSGYFETMRIPLLTGRLFDRNDRPGSPNVAIVSDIAAKTYWPHESPIGKRVSVNYVNGKPVWHQIVGVVRATRHFGLEAVQKPEIYLPHTQAPSPFMVLVVRARTEPHSLIPAIRKEIAAIDPEQAGFGFESMDELLSNAASRRRFQMLLMTAFAALALFLATIGIYGVMAYTVAQRTREIGVRLALGARPRDVVSMVVRKGLLLSLSGMAIGFAGAIALSQVLASLLFEVSPVDPPTFAMVAAVLAATAVLSTYLPSRGAARVDPLDAVREE